MRKFPAASQWRLHLDNYVTPYLSPNFLHRLPSPLAYLLGYRPPAHKNDADVGNILIAFWALVGAFSSIIAIEGLFMTAIIRDHHPPLLIGSFGAAAVLAHNAINAPLAQPRNSVLGHLIATIIGVGVTKLFRLSPSFPSIRFVAGGMACGLASAAMSLTDAVYPPAGATALLAAVDPQIEQLGWYLIPLVLLSTVVMLLVALLFNNVQRRYPTYWWTPAPLKQNTDRETEQKEGDGKDKAAPKRDANKDLEKNVEHAGSVQSDATPKIRSSHLEHGSEASEYIRVTADEIFASPGCFITDAENEVLECLRKRLGGGHVEKA